MGTKIKPSNLTTQVETRISDIATANSLDSAEVVNLIDSTYIRNLADSDYIKGIVDSDYVKGIVDSDYVGLKIGYVPLNKAGDTISGPLIGDTGIDLRNDSDTVKVDMLSNRGIRIVSDTTGTPIDHEALGAPVSPGMVALQRVNSDTPLMTFHDTDGTRTAYIQSIGASDADPRMVFNQATSNVIDMTGMRIRNSGVKTFLASIASTTDVAIIDLIWSDLNIDPTRYQEIIVEGHNMGITAAASGEFRFFFNDVLYSGATYRWTSTRALYDGTTNTNSNGGAWDDSWFRFSNPNDSTSHWNFFSITIPNPGKNAYSQYATTAYQGYWATARGVDTSSRPRVEDYAGFVNNATSTGVCTGIRLDHTAAADWRNTDIKIYGVVN